MWHPDSFDVLVEPIMSYGCQVWGPEVFVSAVASTKSYSAWSNAEKVHLAYLRTMAGVGECCIEVLMRDFNRKPINADHWVLLAARLFMTLKCMPDDRLAHCAWVADIDLMLAGCRTCWTYQLLHTMSLLGVLSRNSWDHRANSVVDRHSIMHLQLVPKAIKLALHGQMASRWAGADVLGQDPRVAPSVGIEMSDVHSRCMGAQISGGWLYCAETFEIVCIIAVLQCLARLRLGWHQLRVRTDRLKKAHARLPRNQRSVSVVFHRRCTFSCTTCRWVLC
jgi:hypothetical protein